MGVFGQPKRSNVALTRAEFLFIVVRLTRVEEAPPVYFALFGLIKRLTLLSCSGREPGSYGQGLCMATIFALLPS